MDDNTYVINIYRCFKGYSAYVSYPENVLEGKRILIMNGYYLMYPNMDIYRYVNHYDEEILWGQDAWLNPDLYYVME